MTEKHPRLHSSTKGSDTMQGLVTGVATASCPVQFAHWEQRYISRPHIHHQNRNEVSVLSPGSRTLFQTISMLITHKTKTLVKKTQLCNFHSHTGKTDCQYSVPCLSLQLSWGCQHDYRTTELICAAKLCNVSCKQIQPRGTTVRPGGTKSGRTSLSTNLLSIQKHVWIQHSCRLGN